MKKFMGENFLLTTETSKKLFHEYAKDMPIFDYHCHLKPEEIADNKQYKNITEVWLGGDHYKWRAMRSFGVPESHITGDAPDKEKFMKWAKTVEYAIGNPLHHWTHLELQRFFDIKKPLGTKTAEKIWDQCNEMLVQDSFRAQELIKRSNVTGICTTDDPVDSLEYHQKIAKDDKFDVKVCPTWRPDKSFLIGKPDFKEWVGKLEKSADMDIKSFDDYQAAITKRFEFFHENGCRISDHALDPITYTSCSESEATAIFDKVMGGGEASLEEQDKFKTFILVFCGKLYAEKDWAMQLHLGCMRNLNSRMFKKLGPDTGYDAIGDYPTSVALAGLLDALASEDKLPKTILYTLNPAINEVLGTVMGAFQGGGIKGKIQFGSGWWFNDTKSGMIDQMTALANLGLLSAFVGMLTDSRSFLSYPRHEYFRRILCELIGGWVENGEYPDDFDILGKIVRDISYDNAKNYFNIV